jgi:hypothetical protein
MKEPISIRYLVLYALLTSYGLPVLLLSFCAVTGRGINEQKQIVLFMPLWLGFFGALIWCIRFLSLEPGRTRQALIVFLIITVVAVASAACPRL